MKGEGYGGYLALESSGAGRTRLDIVKAKSFVEKILTDIGGSRPTIK